MSMEKTVVKSRYSFPTRTHWVKDILENEADKNSELAVRCNRYLRAQDRYQSGEGDVIGGLLHMDNLEEEIRELTITHPSV